MYSVGNEDLRSVLIFANDSGRRLESGKGERVVSDFGRLQWMRTLDFDGIDCRDNMFPKGIDKLVYLRYLGFRDCYVEELPSACCNFPFLETLDLQVTSSCKMIIPHAICKLYKLRHLYFPVAYQSDHTQNKLHLDGMVWLETLENFHPGVCEVDCIRHLEKL